MKTKHLFWLLILVLALFAAACAPQGSGTTLQESGNTTQGYDLSPEALIGLLGDARSDVLKRFGLAEKDIVRYDTFDEYPLVYSMDGRNYAVCFGYDIAAGDLDPRVIGFFYSLKGTQEELIAAMSSLMENYKSVYGEPSTYPTLDTRYFGAEDVSKVLEQKEIISETWNLGSIEAFENVPQLYDFPCLFLCTVVLTKNGALTAQYAWKVDYNQGSSYPKG